MSFTILLEDGSALLTESGSYALLESYVATTLVSPSGVSSSPAFGTTRAAPGFVRAAPTGAGSSPALGIPGASAGTVRLAPVGTASAAAGGHPLIAAGSVISTPSGITALFIDGQPSLAPGPVALSPPGFSVTTTRGVPSVGIGPAGVVPDGIAGLHRFGGPSLTNSLLLSVDGVHSSAAFGTLSAAPGPLPVSPGGASATFVKGTPIVFARAVNLAPRFQSFSMTVGLPAVSPTATVVAPQGVPSSASFGTPDALWYAFSVVYEDTRYVSPVPSHKPTPSSVRFQVGDVGMELSVVVVGIPYSVREATALSIVFEKPDGTVAGVQPVPSSADTLLYRFINGDIDQPGVWRYQVLAQFDALTVCSDVGKFKVYGNLPL